MKDIRILMLHTKTTSIDTMLDYLHLTELKKDFNFIWDNENPDYLISTEHIYFHKLYQKKYYELGLKTPINILFAVELYPPDMSLFDYATTFYSRVNCDDRCKYLLSPDKFYSGFVRTIVNDIINVDDAAKLLHEKVLFCNFLYSNSQAHPNRDKMFYKLSDYKQVDSIGRWLNNVGSHPQGWAGHQDECIQLKSPYKFSIAFENATCPGYSSEKILTSLNAHTIPIYWGDPDIENYINPECFVNCNKYKTLDEAIEEVKKIDSDDDLWCKMISQPWQTPEQIALTKKRNDDYVEFWRNIFSQNIEDAKRVPVGYHPNLYFNFITSAKPIFYNSFFNKCSNKLSKIFSK